MAAPNSPIGSRRRLGAELRRHRLRADLTLDEVAAMMTCSTSKISRLETGKGVPKVPDVRELMRIYGVASETEGEMLLRLVRDGRQHGWWEPLAEGISPERYVLDWPGRYPSLENDATAIGSFHVTVMHGLLQTERYARTVLAGFLPHHGDDEIDKLLAIRAKRQEALHRTSPPPLRLTTVLDEGVLRRDVGGPAVMREQLLEVRRLAAMPNVRLQVLPFEAGIRRAHAGSFVILRIPEDLGADVVYIEGPSGETYLDTPSAVDLYGDVLDDVLSRALSAGATLAFVDRCLDELPPAPRGNSNSDRLQDQQLL